MTIPVLHVVKTLSVCEENSILLVTNLRDGEQVEMLQFLHIIDILKIQRWSSNCPFANVTVDSNISLGGASSNHAASTSVPAVVPTGASTVPTGASSVLTDSPSVPADFPPSVAPTGVSNKGKAPMVDEDILIKERTFKQIGKDRLGKEAAKRLHDEEQAHVNRQRVELQSMRQQEVLDSAMYHNEANWIHIMAQVEANASLFKTLLGDDVTEDNFPARMAALIKRKKQALAENWQRKGGIGQ
nr:JmjC domain-containing protein [Tanacetum cinerariifolium]